MSKPPEIVSLDANSVDKKYTDVVKYLASVLNPFFLQVHQSMNRALSLSENFLGTTKSLTVTGGSSVTFKYDGNGSPTGIILASVAPESGNAAITDTIGIPQWYKSSTTEITIHPIKGLVTGSKYQILVIVVAN
jgi:hypothetical protein